MFVYERDGAICVTFKDNKPVEAPEYKIVIKHDEGKIEVNGTEIAVAGTEAEPKEEPATQSVKRTSKKVVDTPVVDTPVEG